MSTHARASTVGKLAVLLVTALTISTAPAPHAAAAIVDAPPVAMPVMTQELLQQLQRAGPLDEVEVIVTFDRALAWTDLERATDMGLLISRPLANVPAFLVRGTSAEVIDHLAVSGASHARYNTPLEYMLDTARTATLAESVTANLPGIGGPLEVAGQAIDGTGVGIAIVDGGIDATHPDLPLGTKVARQVNYVCASPGLINPGTGYCFANWLVDDPDKLVGGNPDVTPGAPNLTGCAGTDNFVDIFIEGEPSNDHSSGHGTHVAGIAAGTGAASGGLFRGVAPGATLYGYNAGETLAVFGTMESFDHILCIAASSTPPIRVINNSWGTVGCNAGIPVPSDPLTIIMTKLTAAGITVVFASGNSGGTGTQQCTSNQSVTRVQGVIGVANYHDEARGTQQGTLSTSSSRGLSSNPVTWPDVSAPGSGISSAYNYKTGHSITANGVLEFGEKRFAPNYLRISGTSMAAPHVAGVIALMVDANPAITPAQIENILEDTAVKFAFGTGYVSNDATNLDNSHSFDKGHGLVNARAAVQAAAALGSVTLTDAGSPPVTLNAGTFYLRTAPDGIGNLDADKFGWAAGAPTKEAPSVWHDVPLRSGSPGSADDVEVTAAILHGDVDVSGTTVDVRFWAKAPADASGQTRFEVVLEVGGTRVSRLVTPTTAPGDVGEYHALYDLTGLTVRGTSIKVRVDTVTILPVVGGGVFTGGATMLYDSIHFPSSLSFGPGSAPVAADPLPAVSTVCILSRPECFDAIQGAIDAAAPGETVTVGPGSYAESLLIDHAVRVESVLGPLLTEIAAPAGLAPVTITGADAAFFGFAVTSAAPGLVSSFIDVQGANALVEFNDVLGSSGTGISVAGDGATLVNNLISNPTGIRIGAAASASLLENLLESPGTNVLVAAGAGATTIEGNDLSVATFHVNDLSGGVDVAAAFEGNAYDRALAIDAGGLVGAIYGDGQTAINAAPAGSSVIFKTGTYSDPLTVPAGKTGLTLCSTSGAPACLGSAGGVVLDVTGVAPVALTILADDVTVEGLAIRAASMPGVAIDGSGSSGLTLIGNRIEAGPNDIPLGAAEVPLSAPLAGSSVQEYLADPFVSAAFTGSALRAIRDDHSADEGFLAAVPLAAPEAHVALLYTSAAPASVHEALASSGGVEHDLPVRVHEDVQPTKLIERVDDDLVEQVTIVEAGPDGPHLPATAMDIGPGSHMLITRSDGTFRCTANFVFRDPSTDKLYLGTAGHCLLAAGVPSSLAASYTAPSVRVCIDMCFGSTVRVNNVFVNLGATLFAQQEDTNGGFGEDFGWVEIPAALEPLARSWQWFWGGPTQVFADDPAADETFGSPVVHYGNGVGVGEEFPTKGRAGVGLGWFSSGPADEPDFFAAGWATGGDSGSAVLSGAARVDDLVVGDQAIGDLTHSIQVVGAPIFIGTRVTQGLEILETKTGVVLTLVDEDDLEIPLPLPEAIGIDLTGASGADVLDNVILLDGGGCQPDLLARGMDCFEPQVTGIDGAPGALIQGNTISGEPANEDGTIGATNGVRGDLTDALVLENTISWFSGNGVFAVSSGLEVLGNTFTHTQTAVNVAASDVLVQGNSFEDNIKGVAVFGSPSGTVLRYNVFSQLTGAPLVLASENSGIVVDARLNNWGVDSWRLVQARAFDEDVPSDNTILLTPFITSSGSTEPGLPTSTPATHSMVPATCDAHPDAFWDGTQCVFLTIQAALDFSHAGGTLIVPGSADPVDPAPYFENIVIGVNSEGDPLDGLHVCTGTCTEPNKAGTILDGSLGTGAALTIEASDVLLEGFTVRGTSPLALLDDADGSELRANSFELVPDPISDSDGVLVTGGDGPIVRQNSFRGNLYAGSVAINVEDADEAVIAQNVITGAGTGIRLGESTDGSVRGNIIRTSATTQTGSATLGVSLFVGEGHLLLGNTYEGVGVGVNLAGSLDARSLAETWIGTATGIRVRESGGVQPAGFTARYGDLGGAPVGVLVEDTAEGVTVDARLMEWGVPSWRVVEARVVNDGSDVVVKVLPYRTADGSAEPPLPTASPATHSTDPDTCDAHPDAFWDVAALTCRFLTLQAAIDFSHPGSTIVVPMSRNDVDPTPHFGPFEVIENSEAEALDGVTLCSSVARFTCALEAVPGRWEFRDDLGMTWQDAPADGLGEALHISGVGATSLFPQASVDQFASDEPFQVEDVTALSYDLFVAGGSCGAGSPRIALGIDLDGDDARDENVLVYPSSSSAGCATGRWVHDDLFRDVGAVWNAAAFGGSATGTQAQAQAAVEDDAAASGATHRVVAVNFQFDNGAASVYLDNQRVNDWFLRERTDVSCFVPNDVEANCPNGGAARNTILDGDGGAAPALTIDANGVSLVGFTLRGSDPALSATGDGLALASNIVEVQLDALASHNGIELSDATLGDVRDNEFRGNEFPGSIALRIADAEGLVVSGNIVRASGTGIYAADSNGLSIEGNTLAFPPVSEFAADSLGVSLFRGSGHRLASNAFFGVGVGLNVAGAQDVTSAMDSFVETTTGIRAITAQDDASDLGDGLVTLQPTGLAFTNDLLADTATPLELGDETELLNIPAECNDWGVYNALAIPARIDDQGTANVVDFEPFTAPDNGPLPFGCLIAPVAQFAMSPSPATRRDVVDLQDQSLTGSKAIVTWEWNFGDGMTRTLALDGSTMHQYDAIGTYDVILRVTDADGMTGATMVQLDIENLPPALEAIGDQSVMHGDELRFTVTATDAEDDVALSASNLPAGAVFTDNGDGTGEFVWTPTDAQIGLHTDVGFHADDEMGGVVDEFINIDVLDTAPVFDPLVGPFSVLEGDPLAFDVAASDAEGDAITLSASGVPAGASFADNGGGAGAFDWPSATAGLYTLTVTASALGESADMAVEIAVGSGNLPPLVSAPATVRIVRNTPMSITATATDPDGGPDPISWTVTSSPNPVGSTVTASGDSVTFRWTPPSLATTTVTFRASDGHDSAQASTVISILQRPGVSLLSPLEVSTGALTDRVIVGEPTKLRGTAADADGVVVDVSIFPEGIAGASVSGVQTSPGRYEALVTYATPGQRTIALTATDNDGLTKKVTRVIDVVVNGAPTVDAGADIAGDAARPPGLRVTLAGTATDPDGRTLTAASYRWNLPASAGGGSLIGPTVDVFIPVGAHDIELEVTDANGAVGSDTMRVTVDDQIFARAMLEGATGDDDVKVVSDPNVFLFKTMDGTLTVSNDLWMGVEGAHVVGVVRYYGSVENEDGVETTRFEGDTDADGVLEFSYKHDLLGLTEGSSLASLPGYHELEITVTAPSRPEAPVQDVETATQVIKYVVRPDPPPA